MRLVFSLVLVFKATLLPGGALDDEWSTFPLYEKVGYDQPLLPQFHFTSRMNRLNDPNGVVFYDGTWLMCFQHNPVLNDTGMKAWGAAVSPDLMHWEQLHHAINPYPNVEWAEGDVHAIWSSSAVVDVNNAPPSTALSNCEPSSTAPHWSSSSTKDKPPPASSSSPNLPTAPSPLMTTTLSKSIHWSSTN
ncbi:MAG: hypothetical protein AAGA58_20070 [Verrucomicrobiota bacterium]